MKNWKDKPKNENSLVKQSGLDKLLSYEEHTLDSLNDEILKDENFDQKNYIQGRIDECRLTIETIKILKNV